MINVIVQAILFVHNDCEQPTVTKPKASANRKAEAIANPITLKMLLIAHATPFRSVHILKSFRRKQRLAA
jgi:hypothetical protein